MDSKFYADLSQDLLLMLNDAEDYNVIIQTGDNQNIKEFRASTYIHTCEVDLSNQSGNDILGVLFASDELLIEKLFIYVQDHLIEKQSVWVKENYVPVLHTIAKFPSCKKLYDHCVKSICADPQSFITSKNFSSLDKDILYSLLERDDLNIEEIDAWDCLIKWGIEQTFSLESNNNDRTKWNDNNFEALKKTLNQFIPLIRFVEISSSDFFNKVRPYRAIQIESKLIEIKPVNIISNWIERKNGKNPSFNKKYKFDLLYRSSRDGINANTLRTRCNNQGSCLVLIKHHQSTKIYGGYNPIGFIHSNGHYCYTKDSFIFSFENSEDIQNMKISRVNSNHYDYAIDEHYSNGFNFGDTLIYTLIIQVIMIML
ncbi:hypothetical protein RclHR1_00330026 [Rhizophagus clarus]|uniref:TLDc domain-containing protein n=1 Tax=Rhizophagus clarus TaxID=94130 RepID=A0A2Z6S305_9GLOM|nr:hypothetical protein RclHR1_00330023 [Rhizophagus clarus]GBB98699.1 hypothetical protein RclHR1_00330026 [Rhizophagus clarus]